MHGCSLLGRRAVCVPYKKWLMDLQMMPQPFQSLTQPHLSRDVRSVAVHCSAAAATVTHVHAILNPTHAALLHISHVHLLTSS